MKKIILVAGARPNFMKIAPIIRAMTENGGFKVILVHTGQHYDTDMSSSFFEVLGIRDPDYNLEVGSGTHAFQTAEVMVRFENVCIIEKPNIVLVVGDVNSTIAAGLVAKKLKITLAHVEAGLRSKDLDMPEEINRLATDAITDIFFTTEEQASINLKNEGHSDSIIHYVGHVMIDNLFYQLNSLKDKDVSKTVLDVKSKIKSPYICMTLHRPSNVDEKDSLLNILNGIHEIAKENVVIFPCHPRTKEKILKFNLMSLFTESNSTLEEIDSGIVMLDPLNYDDFLFLWKDSMAVITDSGGLQEETTAIGIPCMTLRNNTERPVTVEIGTNILIGSNMEMLNIELSKIRNDTAKSGVVPDLWDGKASERISNILC